jgi:chemotaxis family two-component system response regulator Rcp1
MLPSASWPAPGGSPLVGDGDLGGILARLLEPLRSLVPLRGLVTSPSTVEQCRSDFHPPSVLPTGILETHPRLEPAIGERLPRSILLVEDNPGDVRLAREALANGSIALKLFIAQDGLEALRLLQQSSWKPDLILLDLNLPGLDGRSLLRRIKSDPRLLRIPVIVLTGSGAPLDVSAAYDLHANCYLVKPPDFATFQRALQQLVSFWAGVAHLPNDSPS